MAFTSGNTCDNQFGIDVDWIYCKTVLFHSYIKSCRAELIDIYNHLWRIISHAYSDFCPGLDQTATCDTVKPVTIYKLLDFLETLHPIKVPRLGDNEDPTSLDLLRIQKLFRVAYNLERGDLQRIEHVMSHMKSHLEKKHHLHRRNVQFHFNTDNSYVIFRTRFQLGPMGDVMCLLTHVDLCIGLFINNIHIAATALTTEGQVPVFIESKPDLMGLQIGLRDCILHLMAQFHNIPSEKLKNISLEKNHLFAHQCITLISKSAQA